MSWTTTQQQQPQYQLWSASTGYSGAWPPTAPAGYPGPPPVPAGVNPQAWTSGRWQFNPMFRGPVPQAGQTGIPAWIPHPSWGPQVASAYAAAAAANYNPYKRQPNPGDRDYWSTKLSDNPLGLENMHIRDTEHKKTRENGVMHTPWVWVPKELCESPEKDESTDVPSGRDGKEETEGRVGREGSRAQASRLPSREPSRSRAPTAEPSRYPQERQGTSYGSSASTSARDVASAQPRAQDSRARYETSTVRSPRDPSQTRTEEPNVVPPPPPNMPNGYTSAYSTYSQQHQRQRSRDVSPRPADAPQPRSSPNPPTSSASAAAAAMQAKPSALEAFSSKQQLHPTFSPSIVRTPKHYSSASVSTPTRRSTMDDSHSASAHARRSSGEPPSQTTTPSRPSGDETHYATSTPTPTPRRSTHEDSHTAVSPGHHQHGPIYAPASASTSASNTPSRSNSLSKPSSRSNSLTKRRSSAPTPASGSPSADAAPLPFLASFSEEPEGLLSPLMTAPRGLTGGPSPRESPGSRAPSSGRELGRSSTYPSLSASTTFESIPEDRAVPPSRTPKPQDRERERSRYSDPESTPYAGVRSPPRSSHASPEAAPQKMTRSATYPVLDERPQAPYASSRSPPAPAHASYASSRSPSALPSPSYTSSRSPPTATARSPRSPTEAAHARSREPSRSRGASPARGHNPLPRPPMPSNYPTTMSSASAAAYSSASKAPPAAGYSSGTQPTTYSSSSAHTRSASTYPSSTQPTSAYSSTSQPASTYSSSTQPAAKYSSSAQPTSGTQPSSHHHHRSSSTQPSAMYTSASQSSSAYASHKQPASAYSSGTQHHHHHASSSAAAAAYTSASAAHTSSAPMPQPAHRSPGRKVRKGYWNRRGDHLVYDQGRWYMVYAPRELANPSELAHYPAPTEGFMDHHGNRAKYDPSVPELPESLPLHGELPKRPYQEFIQYVHV